MYSKGRSYQTFFGIIFFKLGITDLNFKKIVISILVIQLSKVVSSLSVSRIIPVLVV